MRIIVPYPAGGTTDLMARALQEPMQKTLGQPVIIDNKAGAGGAIGAREVARSPADGYTLLFSNNGPSSTVPILQKDAGYDSLKDFSAVSQVSTAPLFVVVNAAVPATTVKQLIDYGRRSRIRSSTPRPASVRSGTCRASCSRVLPGSG